MMHNPPSTRLTGDHDAISVDGIVRAAKQAGASEVIVRACSEHGTEPVPRMVEGNVVYFVKIGQFVKIGRSGNLAKWLRAIQTYSPSFTLLLTLPGASKQEKLLHRLFHDNRVRNELFKADARMISFIETARSGRTSDAWDYLENTRPDKLQERAIQERQQRIVRSRKTRSEEKAYFASLVAERKMRLGW